MSADPINLGKTLNKLTREYAKKIADYKDAAVYSYIQGMCEIITARGDDPEDYELLFIAGEMETTENHTYHINQRIRVRKYK